MSIIKKNEGFSLMSVMVGVALTGLAAVGVMKLSQIQFKSVKSGQAGFEVNAVINEIRTILSDPVSCMATFSTDTITTGADTFPVSNIDKLILKKNITHILKAKLSSTDAHKYKLPLATKFPVGSKYGSSRLLIEKYELEGGAGDFTLKVFLNKGNGTYTTDQVKKIKIQATTDNLGNYRFCVASSAGIDSLWTIGNLGSIYYSGGSVGIGEGPSTSDYLLQIGGASVSNKSNILLKQSSAELPTLSLECEGVNCVEPNAKWDIGVGQFDPNATNHAPALHFTYNNQRYATLAKEMSTGHPNFVVGDVSSTGGDGGAIFLFSGRSAGTNINVPAIEIVGSADGTTTSSYIDFVDRPDEDFRSRIWRDTTNNSFGMYHFNGPVVAVGNRANPVISSTPVTPNHGSVLIFDDGHVQIGSFVGSTGVSQMLPKQLEVNGGIIADGDIVSKANVHAINVITPSDRKLKKNILPLKDSLDKILNLNGVSFLWKDKKDKTKQFGLIAQEVEKVLPEIVVKNTDGMKAVKYQQISAILIEAIKEQQKMIESQSEMIKKLEVRVENIESEGCVSN